MQRLRRSGLAELLPTLHQPVLGICLGMQLLFERSEEGSTECLGVLPGTVRRLRARRRDGRCRTWDGINSRTAREDPLLEGIEPGEYVYFVHSYAVPIVGRDACARRTTAARFPRSSGSGNFWGTQFHPERSAAAGRAHPRRIS